MNFDELIECEIHKVCSISILSETSYKGNIGIMELVKFYKIAPKDMTDKLLDLIKADKNREAWLLVQKVTGVKLKENLNFNKNNNKE